MRPPRIAALVAVTIVTAAVLLREEGRGQRVSLVELRAGRLTGTGGFGPYHG